MRISLTPQVCSGLLCSFLMLIAGCGNPSSQTLDSLTVTATPSTLPVGGAAVLKAVAHLSDGTTQDVTAGTQWSLSNTALATIGNGAITAKAAGTVTVQAAYVEATPAGTSPSAATASPQNLSASTQITITAAGKSNVPTITWDAPAAISYGTALSSTQLNATANVAGTFAYTPAAGTMLKVGKQQLSVTFTPTDTKTYSAATASVQLSVNQATPVITWATPAPIATGTALSATQLNATANVPGSFMYNPAAGAVLGAGSQQLTAVFSPTDATDYASATAHTTLTVGSPSNPPSNPTGGPIGGPIGPAPTGCGGPTINVNSGMSQSTLQSTISSAPSCALIVFAAGTYNISSSLHIPCSSKLTLTGPAASPATAIISGTFANSTLFTMTACSGVTIEFLGFNGGRPAGGGGGGIYVGPLSSNITISYNNFYGMQAKASNSGSMAGIFFDGNSTQYDSNLVMNWNTFGRQGDCSSVMNEQTDDGGLCSAILFQNSNTNVTANNNTVAYLEEGFKILPQRYCANCTFDNNDFGYIHRIAIEFQIFTAKGPLFIEHNSFHDFVDGYYSTMGISTPCCFDGSEAVNSTVSDNVLIANNPAPNAPPEYIPFAVEFWGDGSLAQHNLIQGYWDNGITWGYVSPSTAIQYNNICGPNMAAKNWFVSNEEHQTTVITTTPNTTSATCSTVASTPPAISPAAGAISSGTTVTLSDSGLNHSVYYTTDGSTPTMSSTLYTGPFSVSPGTTVKAIGMWGQGANAKSYPAGYGYVPSSVVSASYTSAVAPGPVGKVTAAPTTSEIAGNAGQAGPTADSPVSAQLQSVTITPSQAVVAIGSTTQLKAVATFNDGSVKDVTAEFGWQSSDPRTVTANASGFLAGLASGPAVISGSYQGHQASVPASSSIGEVNWSSPIVITEGGTYSGNWQSTDAKTPAVTVATTAPVTIENAHVRSVGSLIKTTVAGTNLTVRNSLGVAVNATAKGQPNGIFLEVASPARLDVENNYIENAQGGVIVHGYAGNRDGEQTIVIRSNRARNLNGLLSDGNGGYLPGEGSNHSQARFIQFDSVQSVPGIDVGWNEVINYPGHSLVEDNIDLYRSGGTLNRPLEIHDTYIQGAYPYKAAQDAYTGGGIKTDAKAGDSAQDVPAFNSIHDNQVVGTVSYGIQFAAGHDNVAANNRVISSGVLADGTKIAAQYVGMANSDASGAAVANGSMYNNAMHDNLIGWTCWQSSCAQQGYRKDQFFPAAPADYSTNSVITARQITFDMENNEYQIWVNKMAAAGVAVGPSF